MQPTTCNSQETYRKRRRSNQCNMKRRTWYANKISESKKPCTVSAFINIKVRSLLFLFYFYKLNWRICQYKGFAWFNFYFFLIFVTAIIPNSFHQIINKTDAAIPEQETSVVENHNSCSVELIDNNSHFAVETTTRTSSGEQTGESLFLEALENLKLEELSTITNENSKQSMSGNKFFKSVFKTLLFFIFTYFYFYLLSQSFWIQSNPLQNRYFSFRMNFDFVTSTIWTLSSPSSFPTEKFKDPLTSDINSGSLSSAGTNWTFSCSKPSTPFAIPTAPEEEFVKRWRSERINPDYCSCKNSHFPW